MKIDTIPDLAMTLPQRLFDQGLHVLGRIPNDLIALIARLSIAAVFWQSGQTKVDGWVLSDNALYLFENEYKLPLIDPWLATHLAAFAEHLFPVLLVIQTFVCPGAWPTHGIWAVCLLFIAASGPGVVSLDTVIARRCAYPPRGE